MIQNIKDYLVILIFFLIPLSLLTVSSFIFIPHAMHVGVPQALKDTKEVTKIIFSALVSPKETMNLKEEPRKASIWFPIHQDSLDNKGFSMDPNIKYLTLYNEDM